MPDKSRSSRKTLQIADAGTSGVSVKYIAGISQLFGSLGHGNPAKRQNGRTAIFYLRKLFNN